MGKLEKDKDGNLVIVVPDHIRHWGPCQSIMLECGRGKNILELARALKLARSYVAGMLSLGNLAPDIITAVIQGKTPPQMTLAKAVTDLP